MRWLVISLLVSLGVLLIAAAGMAYHIGRQRAKLRRDTSAALEPVDESDLEVEH